MPVHEKASKEQVTFALAIIKADVISDPVRSSRIEAVLQTVFPGVSVILVVEDEDNDAVANYRSRRELSAFASRASCLVVRSSKIRLN